ncbi:hydrolase [Microbacterium sp. CH12i]|uniref:alpha/beta fold hydrolase n=1 Tax=Microbacterium sp. CH12i TaxID=1479651 RepID=UPI000461B71B|nr:alpha/beta hydrolase [Microbacterium sp. CH12i]KDA06896.1 hydrolase [Microbacterium sp. CH12i]
MGTASGSPQQVRVSSGGIELAGDHWPAASNSKGSVLLLHGGGQRRHSWRRTGEWLAEAGWSVWSFDARGHGESGRSPDGDYSISKLVDDAAAIVDVIGQAPVLVGASMGGMTSLIAEGERGPLARALVLVDIVARIESEGSDKIQAFMHSAPNGFATLEDASDAIAAYNPHRPRPKSLDGLRKNLVQREDGRWHWHWDPRVLQRGSEPELEIRYERAKSAARNITVPTLLVRGGHSDIVSDAGLQEMRELIPHAQSVEVGSAGHMIAGDDNDVFTSELLQFIESTPRPQ